MGFESLSQGKHLIPYITLGDPSVEATESLIRSGFDAGAGVIEVGIPFSDPVADGPVIQASHQRALQSNSHLGITDAFDMVKRIRCEYQQPIVFMMSCNLVFHYGCERFFKDAQAAGVNGVVIPDLPHEEADDIYPLAVTYNVSLIFLISPLCSKKRLAEIVTLSRGFIYLISTTGTTGERDSVSSKLKEIVQDIKAIKDIPVCVGFGISTPEQVKTVLGFCDGAIVGSYFVKRLFSASQEKQSLTQLFRDDISRLLAG